MASRLIIYLAFACAIMAASPAAADVIIENVKIVDVETGEVSEPTSVYIVDQSVVAIEPEVGGVGDATRIDGTDRFLIPGLWDSHVHIFSTPTEPETALPLYLINGVTGIRDMGALWPIERQRDLQRRTEAGEIPGPRLVLSGAWVDARPGSWPGMFLADTPQEAAEVVDRIAREDWAAVKSYSMLNEETYLALADSAARHGLPLVGHIPERVALRTAISAAQDGMEHFGRIPMACSTAEAQMIADLRAVMDAGAQQAQIFQVMAARNRIILDTWNEALCDAVVAGIAAAELHVSPTLVVADFYTGNWPKPDAPRMQLVPQSVREAWGEPDFRLEAMTDEVRELAQESIALDRQVFLMAQRAGVPILASSDASFANPYLFHGFSLLDELDLYVSIGLTPREALYTAIVAPPRFFGLEDQDGTIGVGRRADLVLLDQNPLDGLATLRSPRAVIVAGRVLDADRLEQMKHDLLEAAGASITALEAGE